MDDTRYYPRYGLALLLLLFLLSLPLTPVAFTQGEEAPGDPGTEQGTTQTASFCSPTTVTIPVVGSASPYPSTIPVHSLSGIIEDVNVRLNVYSHGISADVDMMLVSPQNRNVTFFSDTGARANNVNLLFDDEAAAPLPPTGSIASGSYQPKNYEVPDIFPSPAPTPSELDRLSTFDLMEPNGTWSLYVVDDTLNPSSGFIESWCLDITTRPRQLHLPLVMVNRCVTHEIEPNDTRTEAVASGNRACLASTVVGALATPEDQRDIYILTLTAPAALRIELDPVPANADFDIGLYDFANNRIAYSVNRGNGLPETIISPRLGAGEYALMVYVHTGFDPSPYQLTIVPSP